MPSSLDHVARNLLLEDELRSVVTTLGARGIESIVLKGIPLARRLFGRLDARGAILDNDVLVRRGDAVAAASVLGSLGYASIDCRTIERQLDFDFQYAMGRETRGGGRVFAELHWAAFPNDLYPVPEELLWRRSVSFALGDLDVRVFDEPLTLIHLAAHYAQHLFSERRILLDVAAAWNLWGPALDREDLRTLAAKIAMEPVLVFALRAADDLGLLTCPPPAIASRKAERLRRLLPSARLFEDRPERDYARMVLGLLLAPGRAIPGWLRNRLFPPLENLSQVLEQPISPLLRLRYLTRPLRPIARRIGLRPR